MVRIVCFLDHNVWLNLEPSTLLVKRQEKTYAFSLTHGYNGNIPIQKKPYFSF